MSEIKNPLTNYNFLLRVNGVNDIPCKSVKGFAKEYEYEYIREGGVNDYVHVRKKPADKPNVVTAQRYVYDNTQLSFLVPGFRMIMPMLLLVSRYPGEFNNPQRIYTFTGCTVLKVEYGELSAENGQLLTENVSIAYENVLCVDNMVSEEKKAWQFDGTKTKGKGTRYARKTEDYGVDIKAEKESRKWPAVSSRADIKKYL